MWVFFPFPNNINQPFRRTLTLYISKWQTDQIQFHLSVITAVILLNYYLKKMVKKKTSNTCSRSETVTILFLLRLCVIYCFINTREESQKHVWVHRTIPAPPPNKNMSSADEGQQNKDLCRWQHRILMQLRASFVKQMNVRLQIW